ncbi:kinase-like protein, partial [Rhizopogon vinicolor AM-OR11-026]
MVLSTSCPLYQLACVPRQLMTPPANSQDSSSSKPKHSSPNDLTEFITEGDYVGSGAFGSVYKHTYKHPERQPVKVAVKRLNKKTDETDEAFWREIGIWKRLRHEYIVPLLGTTTCESRVSFVSPWMPDGTLHSYIKNLKKDSTTGYNLLCHVADGLHYLHSESVVHGDLTSKNVLINEKGQACLIDFGLSSMTKNGERFDYLRLSEKCPGALLWSAPELILYDAGETYVPSPSSDIYSYGCIIYEVLSGNIPKISLAEIIQGNTPSRPKSNDMPDEDWVFILQCWLSLPSLRPFASQALKFFRTRRGDHAESREMSNRASIYTAHLDGANIYNLSSLVRSHPKPAFSDSALCWRSIEKLARALVELFTTEKNKHGLVDAIQLYHVSLATLAPSSTFITSSLCTISSTVTAQLGGEQRSVETLDEIERMTGNLDGGNPSHFTGFSYLCLHGIAQHMTKPNDLNSPFISRVRNWYKKSFGNAAIDILCRLQIALACARITENIGQAEFSLEAYETSLQLLQSHVIASDMVAWTEPVEHLSTSLAVDAAAAALRLGKVERAVELLDWGRELLWAYTRSHASERGEKQISESEADRMRYLPPSFSNLLNATQAGPVVVLIASRRSCDAIIVSNVHPQALHVQLKMISLRSLQELSTSFQACTSSATENSESVEKKLKGILRCLWKDIVEPVIGHLKNTSYSRIWWYPTSVFSTLPVHAAGDYTLEGKQLSQLYVSSYTSSITSLLWARTSDQDPKSFSEFAAIYQAKPLQNDEHEDVEYPVIEFAEMEPEIVQHNLPASLSFTRFANATKEDVNKAFKDRGWFHLIAYATQNAYQPLNSSFLMRDGSLSIPDIFKVDLGPKEFAFLSARPVGSRFGWMQNEIIQFAAGLQISGFKSVVGTMGDVDDSKAHEIIDKFYRKFFSTDTPDCTRAAQALHVALEEMAEGGLALGQRIAFAHFGL